MNKLSDEIGEKSENKYRRADTKSNRLMQVFIIAGVLMMIMLVSFILTCRANSGKKKDIDEDDDKAPAASEKRSD